MLEYCPLASGSKGNCLLVRSPETHLLIDCGISLKSLCERLSHIGVELKQISAILITHEHTDHIQGLRAFLRAHNVPVICNRETALAIGQAMREVLPCQLFTTGESFDWCDLHCTPFSISHDAVDPVGFRISWQDQHLGICADVGFISATLPGFLKGCQLLYLESNHDPMMVHASKRPLVYKQRVLSKLGHLSNASCGELLRQLWHDSLYHVYLAHLSEECNEPQLALHTVRAILTEAFPEATRLPIDVALQERAVKLVRAQAS